MTLEELKEFEADISKLAPEEQADLRQRFYYQRVMTSPEWKQLDPKMQERFAGAFNVPSLQSWSPPNFAQRVIGEYGNPMTMNPFTHLGNAMTALGTPGRLIRESMMTPYYDMTGKQRPYRDPSEKMPWEPGGLSSMIPQTLGEWTEAAVGPKAAQIMLSPSRMAQILGKLRALDANIAANKAGAAAENIGWHFPPQKALPAQASPSSPMAMPGRVYSPYELQEMRKASMPQHAPRPPELMPKPKAKTDEVWTFE